MFRKIRNSFLKDIGWEGGKEEGESQNVVREEKEEKEESKMGKRGREDSTENFLACCIE